MSAKGTKSVAQMTAKEIEAMALFAKEHPSDTYALFEFPGGGIGTVLVIRTWDGKIEKDITDYSAW